MTEEAEIQEEVINGVAILTLNRPHHLNAINMTMFYQMWILLKKWAIDPNITSVVVRGSGGKSFCAGGDVLDVVKNRGNDDFMHEVYRCEYVVDQLIYNYPKPFIPLMSGIVMGGGAGISVHAHGRRIVTESTLFAMPETALGLFPDIGASHFLSRMPGPIGYYISLTGSRLTAADALYTGIADYFLESEELENFINAICDGEDPDSAIKRFESNPGPSSLAHHFDIINAHFNADNLAEILNNLESDTTSWAREILKKIRSMCPFSQVVTFENIKRSKGQELEHCLVTDFRIAIHLMKRNDYFEGARAILIDKDRVPIWSPKIIEDVSHEEIEACFASLGKSDLKFESHYVDTNIRNN